MKTIPCARCERELNNVYDRGRGYNQPSRGVEFQSPGHYGSAIWDPMDGRKLSINICDPCLEWLIEKNFAKVEK